MRIAIERFGGLSPRTDPAELPANGAQIAQDVRLHAGALRGWRKPLALNPVVTVPNDTQTIYYDSGEGTWFYWTTDVDIVLGPVADDSDNKRYYFTGDGVPKKTDSTLGLAGALNLKVPTPTAAPTLALGGSGSGTAEDHVYVYTFVSEFSGIEEESAPSPPATITWQPGNSVTVSDLSEFPTTGYNVTKWRIYRSNGTGYLFVDETNTDPYSDTKTNADLGETLTTLGQDTPPDGLTGLVSLANGILAGFVGNSVYFSVAYQPHAWPASYALTTNERIVAIIPVGQGAYILTNGYPYYCAGTTPDSMNMERIPRYAPCRSKRTAATDGIGALYASHNGVAYLTGGTAANQTKALMTQEEWEANNPSSMYGAYYDERYTLWTTIAESATFTLNGAYLLDGTQMLDGTSEAVGTGSAGLVFDTSIPEAPLTLMSTGTRAAHIRQDTGKLYIVADGQIKQFDGSEVNRTIYEWRSKLFQLSLPVNFGAIQVYADHSGTSLAAAAQLGANAAIAAANSAAEAANAAAVAQNNALWTSGAANGGWAVAGINQWAWNGSGLTDLIPLQELGEVVTIDGLSLSLKVYADGELKFSSSVTGNDPIPLPSGFKSDAWEIAISGNKTVRRIVMASNIPELKSA